MPSTPIPPFEGGGMRLYYDKQGKPQLMRTPKRKPTKEQQLAFIEKPREGRVRFVAGGLLGGTQHEQIFIGGMWKDCTSEYDCYQGAKARCQNPHHKSWKDYGGRGILFKFVSFQQFINHIGLKPSPELSIDRINNDGYYTIGNVRWANAKEQSANRRSSKKV